MDTETKKMLTDILVVVKNIENRISHIEQKGSGATIVSPTQPKETRKISMKEFLIEHVPSDGVQKTLAIGYFMETYEGMTSFNRVDIEKGFRAAKERVPANINDKVNMCIKNGHMMEAEAKKDSMKAWILTRTGEDLVQQRFKKNVATIQQ